MKVNKSIIGIFICLFLFSSCFKNDDDPKLEDSLYLANPIENKIYQFSDTINILGHFSISNTNDLFDSDYLHLVVTSNSDSTLLDEYVGYNGDSGGFHYQLFNNFADTTELMINFYKGNTDTGASYDILEFTRKIICFPI